MSEVSLILVLQNKNNLRGGKERIFDDMNNGFGWNRLPKSFMAQNTVFLLMTALIRNFYKAIMQRLKTHEFGLRATSRIKTFVFKFISVPAKWIKTSRRHVLNIYSDNNAYALFLIPIEKSGIQVHAHPVHQYTSYIEDDILVSTHCYLIL